MKIGILQCGHTPDEVYARHGDFSTLFEEMLAGHGFHFDTWNVVDMEFPAGSGDADGWLVTGSKHGAYEDHPFIPTLEDFIRQAHTNRKPMIGICFGHQIIAQALGGRVVKHPGGWAIGRHDYTFDDLGQVALNAWHQDQVVALPPDAVVTGSSPFCPNAAMRIGNHIKTVQAHPELTNPVVADYIAARRGTGDYPDQLMADAERNLALSNDASAVSDELANFLKYAISETMSR